MRIHIKADAPARPSRSAPAMPPPSAFLPASARTFFKGGWDFDWAWAIFVDYGRAATAETRRVDKRTGFKMRTIEPIWADARSPGDVDGHLTWQTSQALLTRFVRLFVALLPASPTRSRTSTCRRRRSPHFYPLAHANAHTTAKDAAQIRRRHAQACLLLRRRFRLLRPLVDAAPSWSDLSTKLDAASTDTEKAFRSSSNRAALNARALSRRSGSSTCQTAKSRA